MSSSPDPTVELPVLAVAELQDHLLAVGHDLDRLQTLLSESCALLLGGFGAAHRALDSVDPSRSPTAVQALRETLTDSVVALQFEDMASQLLRHTQQRVRSCADQLAARAFGADEDGEAAVTPAPQRPNPVTQDEMDAGSIELF